MKNSDLEFTICKSNKTRELGCEVGVRILHIPTDILVESTAEMTQYLNKLTALSMLDKRLKKQNVTSCFEPVIEDELINGRTNLDK